MEKETKTERLQLRLTPMEKRNVAYHAQLMNVSVNEYISLLIRRKRIVICENIPELIYQIQKIGNNINQIAAVANTNQYISINNVSEVERLMKECYNLLNGFIDFISEPEKNYLQNDTSKISDQLESIFSSIQMINKQIAEIREQNG
ncbi:plasmid mobilization protein [Ruminococcus sp.]|uniref:plasmid mobilization protein n=1 Tax=Ruminococcus sp. TaxID=41978 RepID=UPI002E7AA2BF|nr:plasmid mobilization relaxosome protein MobC [Ruminococcus sp.]MEE1262053.1 plasmid mobilization relaxosome protein MobC [Ruminococcus sp.]